MHQVGTFTGANPIELRHGAIGIFDSSPYFRHGEAQTLEEVFGRGTDPSFLAAAQAHWRAGTGGAANILDTDATAVTDLVSFLRTIDDGTPPFPAADLAPNDPTFADAAALCDCEKDPPLGTSALDCRP
jgi:hypothetical protein